MGYLTHYELSVKPERRGWETISTLRSQNEEAELALDENGEAEESCKWYDHEEDLKEFSKLYPDVLFSLRGEGEEAGDIWIKHFRGGKVQICEAQILFDEFDETKLE